MRYQANKQSDGRWFVVDTLDKKIIRIWNWDQGEEAATHAATLNGQYDGQN